MSRYKRLVLDRPVEVQKGIPYRPTVSEMLRNMDVGDSFWVDQAEKRKIMMTVFRIQQEMDRKYNNVEERQRGILGYRYWRVR